ncbi:MAG: hypothetical protein RJA81_1094 [Planctomycetota bacterium]
MHAPEYERMYKIEDRDWWFVSRRELVISHLKRHLKVSDPVILDVGCGTGATARLLKDHGNVIGLDFSQLALSACEKRGIDHLLQGSAMAIPLADNSVDVIVATDILEHLDEDEKALSEFRRILKPGGIVIISVPAYQFLWSAHDEALMHKRRYTSKLLASRIKNAGLATCYHGYALSLLFPLALIRWVSNGLGRKATPQSQHLELPTWVNRLLIQFQRFEKFLFCWVRLPWGLSIIRVTQRPFKSI